MSDEQTNFKVTDRRLFNPDGTPREVAPEEAPKPESPVEAATPSPATPPTAANETPSPQRQKQDRSRRRLRPALGGGDEDELGALDDPAGFVSFVMSIASNAASSMGMMDIPSLTIAKLI